jgi:hypothetical protein
VAQDCPLAAREQRRLLDGEWRRNRMAHEVHACMHFVKAPTTKSRLDLLRCHARGQELPPGYDAVLLAGEV